MKTQKTWVSVLGLFLILGGSLLSSAAHADERHLPLSELKRLGFQPYSWTHPIRSPFLGMRSELPRGLPWPVQFVDASRNVAQNFVQHQDYGGGQYFHKGCDLRAAPGSWVLAPVTGWLEAGYYSYQNNPDGSETKMWKPWDGHVHSDPYFELALVTADGTRFELHHVDSTNLPASTVQALNQGHQIIQAGTQLGHVYPWGMDYDHVHYNIFRADGVILNPEYHSAQIADTTPPKIMGLYALTSEGKVIAVHEGDHLKAGIKEFGVITTETKDGSPYVQTPPYAAVRYDGLASGWDFRRMLLSPMGKWPDIRQVFINTIRLPDGSTVRTQGNYGKGQFVMRIPNPVQARGRFVIELGDTAGNISRINAVME